MKSKLVTLPVKLSRRQYEHLKEIKEVHGRSMASQIRTLVQHQIYGIGQIVASQISKGIRSGQNRSRPMTSGNVAYAGCVKEISKIFEAREELK